MFEENNDIAFFSYSSYWTGVHVYIAKYIVGFNNIDWIRNFTEDVIVKICISK